MREKDRLNNIRINLKNIPFTQQIQHNSSIPVITTLMGAFLQSRVQLLSSNHVTFRNVSKGSVISMLLILYNHLLIGMNVSQ